MEDVKKKLEELYALAVETKDVRAGLAVVDYMLTESKKKGE